uniref:Uncharacterized protein n=1 Tax=Timema cristinae TaxID=61476 RepID=A0A7R9DJZ8_TIMCR|nr:unnamed protein product [Timema cristinae]
MKLVALCNKQLHIFKLINPTLGVAFTDLSQGLVLIATLADIFPSRHGNGRGLPSKPGGYLELVVQTLVPFCQSPPFLHRINDVIVSGKVSAHISVHHFIILIMFILLYVVVLGSSRCCQES